MYLPHRYFLLALLALALVGNGCVTSRQRFPSGSNNVSLPRPRPTSDALATEPGSTEPSQEAPSPIQTVSYRDDGLPAVEAINTEVLVEEAVPIASTEMAASELTLDAIVQLALANNPAIQQAAAASAQACAIHTQVGLTPNPTIGYFGDEIGNDGAAGLHGGFVSQTFVRGDKLAWNRQVIGHDVNSLNWQVEVQRQRVRTDIQAAFYDALAAQRRLELAREFRSVASKGVWVSQERVKARVGTRPDVLQSEIQLNEVDLSIQQADYELAAAKNELAALAGVAGLGDVTLVGELDSSAPERDTEAVFAQIVAMSPQLAAAQANVDRARANLCRQRVQPIPNVTAQLGAGSDDASGNAFANVQLSIPVPVHNQNQGNIRAAQAAYRAAIQNVERIRQSIRRELASVMREYKIAAATLRQYESSILPKAEETLQLMQEAQEAGEFDFLRVLDRTSRLFRCQPQIRGRLGPLRPSECQTRRLAVDRRTVQRGRIRRR